MSLTVDAEAVAAILSGAGVKTYVDPAKAANNRPCVLVAPPSIDYVTRVVSWRLVALAGTDEPSFRAFEQLDALVTGVVAHNPIPIEAAEAASYPLFSERPPVPAYVLRFTTSTEEF